MEIIEGKFSFVRQYLPVHPEALDSDGRVVTVRVKRPEEKGSDVALASHLIVDAMEDRADSYAVVTNDSDLVPPMKLLSARGKSIALVSMWEAAGGRRADRDCRAGEKRRTGVRARAPAI
ncbi:NYN domain-containing protein [Microbacterium sp. SSW1-59]|uniref:NYN domain-containing protein n=1 Tax=Microbacterium xanthum TaxID=3079794 RepID=UPI002AD4CBB0|nr:NYN domain-containing protein [Microbacterium sp. SSW1-59]MDZ8202704.1 NYN domain-containing protein [Microbacterium sp. SSW1-59]